MGNYDYTVTELVKGYPSRAMRMAVLQPLCSREFKDYDVPAMLETVRKQWRARLLNLNKLGWKAVEDDTDLSYASNCPPFSVKTVNTGRTCNRRICPFCWARQVVSSTYDRLLEVLLLPDGGLNPELMVIVTKRRVYREYETPWAELISKMQKRRRTEM
ncbi:MAG: hypothetical protein KDA84_15985, partial [Planctomycetaceae bacterium]|nr:hypothetical protein [Planctomycetaceae bacterium]